MFSTVQSKQRLHLESKYRLQFKCDGTRWRTGREVKGKMWNALGSQYHSHYLGIWCIQHYYRWCAQLDCQQSTEMTATGRFKCTRPFGCKDEISILRRAITFQTQPTACRWLGGEARQSAHVHCCLQTVGLCASGPFDPEGECTIFFWKVKSPRLFTRWQTQRHISRDSHCHLLTTMEFQNCKIITSPASQTCQNYQCLCAWHIGKGESKGIALVILSFGTWWRWVVSFMPQPL